MAKATSILKETNETRIPRSAAPPSRPPRQTMTITGVKIDHFAPTRTPEGDLHYGHGEAGTHAPGQSQRRMLEVEIDVLDKNNRWRHATAHASQQNSSWC